MDRVDTSPLEDMCERIADCPHFTPKWTESGYVVVRNTNIKNGQLDLSAPSFTDRENFEKRIKRAKPQVDDIIFTREAPMGEVGMVPPNLECCLGQRQVLIRPKANINSRYLFAALRSPYVQEQIYWNEGTGSTVSNVRIPTLRELQIPRQSREKEDFVGELLGALDDKMDVNTRSIRTLESIVLAMFDDWFVDFGPVRTKMDGGAPYLASELWELFPAGFDINGYPEGWETFFFSELSDLATKAITPKKAPDRLFEHYSLPAYDAKQEPQWDMGEDIRSNKTTVPENAVLLSKLNPRITRVWLPFENSGVEQIASTEFLVVQPRGSVPRSLLYALFMSSEFRTLMLAMATGTSNSHQRVSPKMLAQAEVLIGNESVFKAFGEFVDPFLERVRASRQETMVLRQMRDFMLPKLISGEISISEAEKEAAEAM